MLKTCFIALFVSGFLCFTGTPSYGETISFLAPGSHARSTDMAVNPAAVNALSSTTESLTITDVPLVTGGSSNFEIKPFQVFASGAQIISVQSDGTTRAVMRAKSRAWSGSDPDHPGRNLFIAANARDELHAVVLGDARSSVTVITPDPSAADGSYRIAPNALPEFPFCGGEILPPDYEPPSQTSSREIRSTTLYDIDLALDIGYALTRSFGSDAEALNDYIVDLIGPVNLIYRRDLQAQLRISDVYTYDEELFFKDSNGDSQVNSSDQLNNYRVYLQANRPLGSSDLNHLLDVHPGLGGVAYLGVLGSRQSHYRCGVSNVYGTDDFPTDINTYYWDTMVIAHEIGHNVGSPHTHCYVPPIDCCYVEPGCSQCREAAPAAGTLMSYCHLQFNNGGSIMMNFHPRCIALMRPLIEASPLVSVHVDSADINVFGLDDLVVSSLEVPGRANTLRTRTVAPVTQTFTIQSSGNIPLQLTGTPAVGIAGSPYLAIASQPGATLLQPGETATFTAQYTPTLTSTVSAVVTIPTNRVIDPVFQMLLAGQVVSESAPFTATFTGATAINEANRTWTEIPIQVDGVPGTVSDVDVEFGGTDCAVASQTGIEHPRIGQLQMELKSPEGTQVLLMSYPGFGPSGTLGSNFCHTVLDDSASQSIQAVSNGQAPFTGSFRPYKPLSAINGERPNGTWTLRIYDSIAGYSGIVHSASVIVRGEVLANVTDWSIY